MKSEIRLLNKDFSLFCGRWGGIVVITGLIGLVIGLSLPGLYLIIMSSIVMGSGAIIGCMGVPTVSGLVKDHLYQDWPLWALIVLFALVLCFSSALSLSMTVAFVVGIVVLRHLVGLLTFSASMCGYWLEPKWLTWRARHHKSAQP